MEKTETKPSRQTLEQQRADAALKAVDEWDKKWKTDAIQRVKELPLMIRNNGLGQTLAVLMKESKKRPESRVLLQNLTGWLLNDSPLKAFPTVTGDQQSEKLLRACFQSGRAQYQMAQQEGLAFLAWLKLFAEAMEEKIEPIP